MRRRAALPALLLVALVVTGPAEPALAHGGPGRRHVPASNYRSRVRELRPGVAGIEVRVVDAGTRLELVNGTGQTVTVLGYDGEPYLRVGTDGVARNLRSPATYLNRDQLARTLRPYAGTTPARARRPAGTTTGPTGWVGSTPRRSTPIPAPGT